MKFVSLQKAGNYANRILSIADQYANRTLDAVSYWKKSLKIKYGNVEGILIGIPALYTKINVSITTQPSFEAIVRFDPHRVVWRFVFLKEFDILGTEWSWFLLSIVAVVGFSCWHCPVQIHNWRSSKEDEVLLLKFSSNYYRPHTEYEGR